MEAPMLTMRRILFATDFSDLSRQAGRTAAGMARHFGSRLFVAEAKLSPERPGRRGAPR